MLLSVLLLVAFITKQESDAFPLVAGQALRQQDKQESLLSEANINHQE